ncbi:MAG: class I SAM-dependent methyltransferase [Syntrophobacteraceae bacterium]
MNENECIFCGIESSHIVIEENGYKGKKCPQCGLIYISPRPSFDEIIHLYRHDDAHISAESHISASISSRLYARHNLKIIRSFIQTGALLEIGAGAGYFLDEARKAGFKPHGLEFNPIQADYIRNKLGIPCEESSLNTSIFGGKQFDVIYHCDVISHFFDPIADFKKINDIMKDDSFLIFETGNLGEVDQVYFKYFPLFQYPDHLFFFTADNLVDLLGKTGFDFVKIYRYSVLPQIKVMKSLSGIKNSIKKHISKSNENEKLSSDDGGIGIKSVAGSQTPNAGSLLKKSLKYAYEYFNYALRYKVGRIVLKANRPQTVIVVAKKSR